MPLGCLDSANLHSAVTLQINGEYFVDMPAFERHGRQHDSSRNTTCDPESRWHHNDYEVSFYQPGNNSDNPEVNQDYEDIVCAPHVVYGFHLVDHVWRRLPVCNIRLAPDTTTPDFKLEDLQGLGLAKTPLYGLLEPMRRREWTVASPSLHLQHSHKIVVGF